MARRSTGYRKTVNHSTGTVTESYRNPITGTRHVTRRKKMSFWQVLKGLFWFFVIMMAIGAIGSIFGLGGDSQNDSAASSSAPTTVTAAPETTAATEPETTAATEPTQPKKYEQDLVVNTATGKIHRPSCHTIKDSTTLASYHCAISDLEAKGYTRCGVCW